MGVIQLYSAANATFAVSVAARINDGTRNVEAITLSARDSGGTAYGPAEFRINAPFVLPSDFVKDGRLKTWTEIQKDIRDFRDAASLAAAAAMEKARDALRETLASSSIDLAAQAGGFLGIDGVGFAGATATARLSVDLVLLDPALTPKPADDVAILTATLSASGTVDFAGTVCGAAMRLDVVVTRGGLINAIPSLSVDAPAGIRVPAFDFRWPKIEWPSLDWARLDVRCLATLLRFDLPIPKFGDLDQPLHVNWTQPPEIAFGIGAQNRLMIATGKVGQGDLVCDTRDAGGVPIAQNIAGITDFRIDLVTGAALTVAGTIKSTNLTIDLPGKTIDQPDALPFTVEIDPGRLRIRIAIDLILPQAAGADIVASLDLPRVLVRAKSDPALLLALHAAYEQTYDSTTGESHGKLTALEIVEPYPVALVALAVREAADAGQALIRLIGAIRLPKPGVPETGLLAVLERIAAMAGAAVKWLARQATSAVDVLLGIAEAVGQGLEKLVRFIRDALAGLTAGEPHVAVEVRLDSRTFAVRQILVSPAWKASPNADFRGEALGLEVAVPLDWRPSLVIDLDGLASVALVALQGQAGTPFTLGTDLWLSREAGIESVRDTDGDGRRADKRLIQVSATLKTAQPLVVFRFCAGKASFFERMEATVTPLVENAVSIASVSGSISYHPVDWANDIDAEGQIAPGAAERLLPFLQSSRGTAGPSFLDNLSQYISVKPGTPKKGTSGVVVLPLDAELNIKTTKVQFPLEVTLNLKTLDVRFAGPETIEIKGQADKNDFDIFGLTGRIVEKVPSGQTGYGFYKLDFSKGDVRLSLADNARLDLAYGKVASGGRGIVFRVDEFGLSRSGLDLGARVDPDTPVQLAGVDMPFRFDSGGLSIRNSEIQAFSIKGSGQLPPELVGEANATISISMGHGKDGSLIVQSAEAALDKSSDPIVCHGTRFTLTLSAIGFQFHDFSVEGAGYHFYFTLTGTAEFRPRSGEFTDGLLKNFGGLTITLDKAPLARDASMLMRAIEFQVAVEPKKRINFFNLFTFELRGIGFHPASPAFGGKPAMSISGQVNFVEAGDIVSPRFDFHKLWIAPPPDGDWRPQVRFDGLTVGVRFGGAASIEGTAIAVDDKLPTLFKPGALPADVTAHGFLASGKLTIKGWGQMAASMGFLELQKKPGGEVRQAFFLYGQAGELSIEIPTPLGPIYLREVGFGFGFRYTLAAFNRADQVHNVKELIQVLDDISKYQGELATVTAWEPEAEGNRLTLALRGLISISSASGETDYNASGEKDLANPVLFDIVAALRSDMTFFMNARVWIARNYADWHDSSATADAWRTNPTLRGYVYLSVPRKEFLGRLIADGTGDVEGKHPELPAPLVQAMKAVRWSATTYIRPGLFHQEFGWPYELGFTFERGSNFRIVCQGGLVNRIEDQAILYGIAFRAKGFAQIGGSIGGRSFGASIVARADFSIDAKFIAYLSIKRFSDTLFYGSLAFDVSISLQVRVWLEFSVGFTDIHLEVGFSLSLTISIALEVAVSPNSLAGRASASVGVGAFGRSVRLGIGFGFNESALNTARSRVERFLSLGLTVATPDAEQGVAPPAPEQPRGPASRDADRVLDHSLDRHDDVSEVTQPGAPPTVVRGRQLQPSGYWAMLFPVAGEAAKGDAERFLMVFVPRDYSETDGVLPRYGADGQPLGTFFAPPSVFEPGGPVPPSLSVRKGALTATVAVKKLESRRGTDNLTFRDVLFGDSTPVDISYDVGCVAVQSGKESLSLGRLLGQCFVRLGDKISDLREPVAREVKAGSERLPEVREAAAQILAEAGRDQIALKPEDRAANDIEERRSSVIASLCESAARLAAGGEAAWGVEVAEPGLDIRALGVAFVVTRTQVKDLFDYDANGDLNLPHPARFELATPDSVAQPVHLFNAPERMFRESGPKLAEPVVEATRTGIRLDWDLEPAFGRSNGIWNDPEFDLKHYRIERLVTMPGAILAPYPARRVTVKAAAPMRLVRDPVSAQFVWRFLRPNAQFVDDLSDLPPDVRAAILPGEGSSTVIGSVRYVVVPVDTAGTDGAPAPLELVVTKSGKPRAGVRRAVLHFEYRWPNGQIRDMDASAAIPSVMLGLDDGKDPASNLPTADRPDIEGDRVYYLRVRTERSVPTGLYGSDAVTDARARPSAGDFAVRQVSDVDFELTLPRTRPDGPGTKNRIPAFDDALPLADGTAYRLSATGLNPSAADIASFFRAIGVDVSGDQRAATGAVGVRFAIRPKPDSGRRETSAPWCPVDITLMVDPREPNVPTFIKLPPIAAPVEIFEHPVTIDAAPLVFDDLGGEAGRVLVWHPPVEGLLDTLIAPAAGKPGLVLLRDGARRVATRVRWNGRPAADDPNAGKKGAKRLARFFGGFDLFEVDAAGEVEGATTAPVAVAIAYKFSGSPADAGPGSGMLRLNNADQSLATELYVDVRDTAGTDCSLMLDQLDESSERLKGQLRLVKATDASRWMAFDLTSAVRAQGYRKLVLVCTDASGLRPFANNDPIVLLFARLPARHIARVQAMPASLAKLDPAEIADFAKVEAHYPSETRRLQGKLTGRRAAWYSPAESYVVWPERVLRSSLSINVDESILTELLSNGRPTHIEASLSVGETLHDVRPLQEGPYEISRNQDSSANLFKLAGDRKWNVKDLRALLQDLTWDFNGDKTRMQFEANPAAFRTARVSVAARMIPDGGAPPGAMLANAEWQVDLDPVLHPVLADAIDWARYETMSGSAFPRLIIPRQDAFDAALDADKLAQCTAIEFALEGWPAGLPQPVLEFRAGGEKQTSLRLEFPQAIQKGQKQFEMLKTAKERLTTTLAAKARKDLETDFSETPARYDSVRLRLRCDLASTGIPPVQPEPIQVLLAIEIRSIALDLDASLYRRYEPVLEPLPKTGAADVVAWFDETPAERDPYGWGILRTLGLGMGLRLYDTETRDYAKPADTLMLMKAALAKALAWYEDLPLGAPFVDVVTRAGGTMKLSSFDGGTPGVSDQDVGDVLLHDALALTQISLRPVVDRWRTYAGEGTAVKKAVAYFAIRKSRKENTAANLEIDVKSAVTGGAIAIADVLDLTTRLARPPSATLSNYVPDDNDGRKELNGKLTDHGGDQSTLTIDITHARPGEVVALVRVTLSDGDAEAIGEAWVAGDGSREVEIISHPASMVDAEPFGRFGDMAGERWVALAGSHASIREATTTLGRYAKRRWPDGWPDREAEAALMARIPDWTRRFIDHGPGQQPPRDIHFSLAEVTRPDPWRVAVQDDGTMDVLFTHDDRRRRLKRYAVRPFGRYEGFVDALRGADAEGSPRVPQLSGAWSDGLASFDDVQKRFEESWSQRLFDVVIPRTEPVAPPVLVAARRIEIRQPGQLPRRVLEFIYKRHPEEILSEANVTVEGALSFETVSVGFWREFGMQRWANDLYPGINPLAAFGNWDWRPAPVALITGGDSFGGLAADPGRHADGWQGTLALRTEALPFFFRVHAAAFASAGVVVSEPVIATVEEGHYDLHLPWKQPLFDEKTPPPTWSVLRKDVQDGKESGIFATFRLPLVRFVDEMPPETLPVWLARDAVPEVFTLPDPLVRYEIRAVAADSAGLSSASPELDLIGQQRDEGADPATSRSGYLANIIGPLFESGTATTGNPTRCEKQNVWWQLGVAARVQQHDALQAESFVPAIDQVNGVSPLTLFELHQDAFAVDAFWTKLAPRTAVTVTVTPVASTKAAAFAQFKTDVTVWRDAYAPYAADPAAREILDFLQKWVDTDGKSLPPASLSVATFQWGLPRIAEGRPAAVTFEHTAIGDWLVPVDAGIAEREKLRALVTVKTATGYPQELFASGVCGALRREMRRLTAAHKEAEPGNRFLDFPPYASPVRKDLAPEALKVGLAQQAARLLPPCADVIAAVPINTTGKTPWGAVTALIAAVEAAPFTAATTADLGALEDGGASALVHFPCDALVSSTVTTALAAVGANDESTWQAISLLLRLPPVDAERETIMAAISTAVTDETMRSALLAFADDAMSGQIFGAGRTPGLKVFRGTANPDEDAIVRAQGEALPCQ
ncbi:hypothetical protein DBIPINDM_001870 [Mesorhizobium sp. AR02]|uniref:hypothetical protein n=1 Tax=Mesorhizobium sp. AR02 TaxID=2865837 RepID=UPI00216105EE|nr:hypothetical protein [Mesorhizobium sp. AR02]UVK55362.1 hypothetical protein DBIPINDM_001870 [Mesorhizobium sp. AR02]